MIDSTDRERLSEAWDELVYVLKGLKKKVPILIMANKQVLGVWMVKNGLKPCFNSFFFCSL
jgi:hypothetical protein